MNAKLILTLSRETARIYLHQRETITPSADLPRWLITKKFGVYITIYNYDKQIRSQAGFYLPKQNNIASEIIINTISSINGMGIYKPISLAELPGLKFKINIIEEITICSSSAKINSKTDGLLVIPKSKHYGLALPPQINSEIMLSQACQQAQVDKVNDNYKLYRLKTKQFIE
jgi:AMMECR1 domain-containing protein